MTKNTLLIFAKYPTPGRVKTRLARQIGDGEAARLYRTMIEMVIKMTRPSRGQYTQVLCYDPPERKTDFEKWFPNLKLLSQISGDLGKRLAEAIRCSLSDSEQVVVIGSDCIDIDEQLVIQAFQKLESADLVIGPAEDGGYYLIGMKKTLMFLFEGISWSTENVFEETLSRAEEAGLRTCCLRVLADIDELP